MALNTCELVALNLCVPLSLIVGEILPRSDDSSGSEPGASGMTPVYRPYTMLQLHLR